MKTTISTKKLNAGHFEVTVFPEDEFGTFETTDMQLIDDIGIMNDDGFEKELIMHDTFAEVIETCVSLAPCIPMVWVIQDNKTERYQEDGGGWTGDYTGAYPYEFEKDAVFQLQFLLDDYGNQFATAVPVEKWY